MLQGSLLSGHAANRKSQQSCCRLSLPTSGQGRLKGREARGRNAPGPPGPCCTPSTGGMHPPGDCCRDDHPRKPGKTQTRRLCLAAARIQLLRRCWPFLRNTKAPTRLWGQGWFPKTAFLCVCAVQCAVPRPFLLSPHITAPPAIFLRPHDVQFAFAGSGLWTWCPSTSDLDERQLHNTVGSPQHSQVRSRRSSIMEGGGAPQPAARGPAATPAAAPNPANRPRPAPLFLAPGRAATSLLAPLWGLQCGPELLE